ncbi:MAG: DUF4339 domain-containing protein [Akkermansiaceae bacterium]|nr:DUF4339 domain-containing protein [Akkermansiaceae bacterium]
MADWYFSREAVQFGPVSEPESRQMLALAEILPTDLMWCDGMTHWISAESARKIMESPQLPKIPPPIVNAAFVEAASVQPVVAASKSWRNIILGALFVIFSIVLIAAIVVGSVIL